MYNEGVDLVGVVSFAEEVGLAEVVSPQSQNAFFGVDDFWQVAFQAEDTSWQP